MAAYLKDHAAKGDGEVAADLARSLGGTLEGMGELDLAADAYKQFAAAAGQGKAQELTEIATGMEDESRRLAAKAKSVEPAGAKPEIAPQGRLVPLDLHSKVNRKLTDSSGTAFQANHMAELPRGEQTFAGVRFQIGDGVIETASTNQPDRPEKAEGLAVDGKAAKIYFLHGTQWAARTEYRSATTWSTTRMAIPPRFPLSTGRTFAIGGPRRIRFLRPEPESPGLARILPSRDSGPCFAFTWPCGKTRTPTRRSLGSTSVRRAKRPAPLLRGDHGRRTAIEIAGRQVRRLSCFVAFRTASLRRSPLSLVPAPAIDPPTIELPPIGNRHINSSPSVEDHGAAVLREILGEPIAKGIPQWM